MSSSNSLVTTVWSDDVVSVPESVAQMMLPHTPRDCPHPQFTESDLVFLTTMLAMDASVQPKTANIASAASDKTASDAALDDNGIDKTASDSQSEIDSEHKEGVNWNMLRSWADVCCETPQNSLNLLQQITDAILLTATWQVPMYRLAYMVVLDTLRIIRDRIVFNNDSYAALEQGVGPLMLRALMICMAAERRLRQDLRQLPESTLYEQLWSALPVQSEWLQRTLSLFRLVHKTRAIRFHTDIRHEEHCAAQHSRSGRDSLNKDDSSSPCVDFTLSECAPNDVLRPKRRPEDPTADEDGYVQRRQFRTIFGLGLWNSCVAFSQGGDDDWSRCDASASTHRKRGTRTTNNPASVEGSDSKSVSFEEWEHQMTTYPESFERTNVDTWNAQSAEGLSREIVAVMRWWNGQCRVSVPETLSSGPSEAASRDDCDKGEPLFEFCPEMIVEQSVSLAARIPDECVLKDQISRGDSKRQLLAGWCVQQSQFVQEKTGDESHNAALLSVGMMLDVASEWIAVASMSHLLCSDVSRAPARRGVPGGGSSKTFDVPSESGLAIAQFLREIVEWRMIVFMYWDRTPESVSRLRACGILPQHEAPSDLTRFSRVGSTSIAFRDSLQRSYQWLQESGCKDRIARQWGFENGFPWIVECNTSQGVVARRSWRAALKRSAHAPRADQSSKDKWMGSTGHVLQAAGVGASGAKVVGGSSGNILQTNIRLHEAWVVYSRIATHVLGIGRSEYRLTDLEQYLEWWSVKSRNGLRLADKYALAFATRSQAASALLQMTPATQVVVSMWVLWHATHHVPLRWFRWKVPASSLVEFAPIVDSIHLHDCIRSFARSSARLQMARAQATPYDPHMGSRGGCGNGGGAGGGDSYTGDYSDRKSGIVLALALPWTDARQLWHETYHQPVKLERTDPPGVSSNLTTRAHSVLPKSASTVESRRRDGANVVMGTKRSREKSNNGKRVKDRTKEHTKDRTKDRTKEHTKEQTSSGRGRRRSDSCDSFHSGNEHSACGVSVYRKAKTNRSVRRSGSGRNRRSRDRLVQSDKIRSRRRSSKKKQCKHRSAVDDVVTTDSQSGPAVCRCEQSRSACSEPLLSSASQDGASYCATALAHGSARSNKVRFVRTFPVSRSASTIVRNTDDGCVTEYTSKWFRFEVPRKHWNDVLCCSKQVQSALVGSTGVRGAIPKISSVDDFTIDPSTDKAAQESIKDGMQEYLKCFDKDASRAFNTQDSLHDIAMVVCSRCVAMRSLGDTNAINVHIDWIAIMRAVSILGPITQTGSKDLLPSQKASTMFKASQNVGFMHCYQCEEGMDTEYCPTQALQSVLPPHKYCIESPTTKASPRRESSNPSTPSKQELVQKETISETALIHFAKFHTLSSKPQPHQLCLSQLVAECIVGIETMENECIRTTRQNKH